MPLRIIVYVFLIVVFFLIFFSIKRQNSKSFSAAIRIFLPVGLICFVMLGWDDLEVRQEIAQNYRQYKTLQSEKRLQDIPPQLVEGIDSIPPGAVVTEDYNGFRLIAPPGKFFTWGVFRLKSLELGTKHININSKDLAEGVPETVNINGIGCRVNGNIELERREKGASERDFNAFRVRYCVPDELKIYVEGKEMPAFRGLGAYFYPSLESYSENHRDFVRYKDYLPKEQPFIEAYDTFNLFAKTPPYRLRLEIRGDIIADMNGNVRLIRGELYPCDTEDCALKTAPKEPTGYKFGQCEYPQGVEAYLVNFKDGMADWHFKIGDRTTGYGERKDLKPLTPQCETQRLSYFIET